MSRARAIDARLWMAISLVLMAVPVLRAEVKPISRELREQFELADFYVQTCDAFGIPIVASEKTSRFALEEAHYLAAQMLAHRPEMGRAIADARVRIAVMAHNEWTTDIPEHSDLKPAEYWNQRARGLGATRERPAVSCGEENLLCFEGDPYAAENIFIHEFGHVIHQFGMAGVDPSFNSRLQAAYETAVKEGLWKGAYAGTNPAEYWAEAVQSWFDTNRENDTEHNHVNTRDELKDYDPRLAALCSEVFGDGDWRYVRPENRQPAAAHLDGLDRTQAPRFSWPKELLAYREQFREGTVGLAPEDAVSLSPQQSDAESVQCSKASRQRSELWIRNLSSEPVEVAWVDFEGQPQKYATLRPGDHHEQSSFVGHVWRLTRESGGVELFVTEANACTIIVRQPEQPKP